MSVTLDETGLHAESCSCLRCESGFRPSAAERWRARDQLQRTQQLFEAMQKKPSKEELRREERRRVAAEEAKRKQEEERRWRANNPPLSRGQVEELERYKSQAFPGLAGGSKR